MTLDNLFAAITSDMELDLRPDEHEPMIGDEVSDRLIDLMIVTDDLLAKLRTPAAMRLSWIEPHLRRAYDEIAVVLNQLSN
jgi:hypothetical protein